MRHKLFANVHINNLRSFFLRFRKIKDHDVALHLFLSVNQRKHIDFAKLLEFF